MDIKCIVFGILFLLIGILFGFGKFYTHLSAWKNMTDEERAEIKIAPLCRNVGIVIMISGAIFLLKGLWSGFSKTAFIIAMVIWIILAFADFIYISKSKRYKNQ